MPTSRDNVERTCGRCTAFRARDLSCSLLDDGALRVRELFQSPCRPDDYIRRVVARYLHQRHGPARAQHADDIASECVESLLAGRHTPSIGRNDSDSGLGRQRRALFSFAIQRSVDYFRRLDGRFRCGACAHYEQAGRRCEHPAVDHPHSGKPVDSRQNPSGLDPACRTFSKRTTAVPFPSLPEEGAQWDPPARDPSPEHEVIGNEQRSRLVRALATVQRETPEDFVIVQRIYFENATLEDVAEQLGVVVRTISRRKLRVEQRLREIMSV